MNIAIILAGGIGSRVGADKPKQFIEILGKPILVYTIEQFQNQNEIDAILIVCVKSHLKYMDELVDLYNLNKVKWIVEGGETFQMSVLNGVEFLKNKISPNDIAVIHFGASPFVQSDIILDAIKVAKEKGNAISTTPFYVLAGIKDNEEYSNKWIDRDTIACMSSPHAFQYKSICRLYETAIQTGVIDEVEPHTTTLMYKMNETIYFSKGNQMNIKITTKEDLELFEGYILLKQK